MEQQPTSSDSFPYDQYSKPGVKQVHFREEGFWSEEKENSSASLNFRSSRFPSLKSETPARSPQPKVTKATKRVKRETTRKSESSPFQQSAIASFANRHSVREHSATLRDLCPEEKAKIGNLVQTLAREKREKAELAAALREKEQRFQRQIRELSGKNKRLERSVNQIEGKFSESLRIISTLQHSQQRQPSPPVPAPMLTRVAPESNSPLRLISNATPAIELIGRVPSESPEKVREETPPLESNETLKEIEKLKLEIMRLQSDMKSTAAFRAEHASPAIASARVAPLRKPYFREDETVVSKPKSKEQEPLDESDLEDQRLEEQWRQSKRIATPELPLVRKDLGKTESTRQLEESSEQKTKGAVSQEDFESLRAEMRESMRMMSSMLQTTTQTVATPLVKSAEDPQEVERQKLAIYEEIKQRLEGGGKSQSQSQRQEKTQASEETEETREETTPEVRNKFSSMMKSVAKSSGELRVQRLQPPGVSPGDFSYSLSTRFHASRHAPSPPTRDGELASQLNSQPAPVPLFTPARASKGGGQFYDDSLFNLIDEIESQGPSSPRPRRNQELPLQQSELVMSRSGVIKVCPKEVAPPPPSQPILVQEKTRKLAPTTDFSFALKTPPLSIDRGKLRQLPPPDPDSVRPFENVQEEESSEEESLQPEREAPQPQPAYVREQKPAYNATKPAYTRGTVASTMRGLGASKSTLRTQLRGLNFDYEE